MATSASNRSLSASGRLCAERLYSCPTRVLLRPAQKDAFSISTIILAANKGTLTFEEHRQYVDLRQQLPHSRQVVDQTLIVSICSRNSYSPLQIGREDLQQLVIDEDVDPNFANIVVSFGTLPRWSEQGYGCLSKREKKDGSFSISYLLRFVEEDSDKNWKIRQLGVLHQYSKATNSHFWIYLQSHPPDQDSLSKQLIAELNNEQQRALYAKFPSSLHSLIFETYIPHWRWYLNFLGDLYHKLSKTIGTVEMESDGGFELTLDTLQDCQRLLEDITVVPIALSVVRDIARSVASIERASDVEEDSLGVETHISFLEDARRSAEILIRQAQSLVELLSNELDLKNQHDAATVNQSLFRLQLRTTKDSAAIRVITLVTLFYLPATSIATLFGMNFFEFNKAGIMVTGDLWIFFVAFAVLTSATLLLWRTWMKYATRESNIKHAGSAGGVFEKV